LKVAGLRPFLVTYHLFGLRISGLPQGRGGLGAEGFEPPTYSV